MKSYPFSSRADVKKNKPKHPKTKKTTSTCGAVQSLLYQEVQSLDMHLLVMFTSFWLTWTFMTKMNKSLLFLRAICSNACWSYLLQTKPGFNCTGALSRKPLKLFFCLTCLNCKWLYQKGLKHVPLWKITCSDIYVQVQYQSLFKPHKW